jgi:predicted DNA-binding ArsR family transcriptional regulator
MRSVLNMSTVKFEISTELQLIIDSKEIKFESKSDLMRGLYDNNYSVSQISKYLNSHYSFVYGVIERHTDGEIRKEVKESKSDVIRKMSDEGYNPGEIAKALNSNYSYVFSVVKKHKNSNK